MRKLLIGLVLVAELFSAAPAYSQTATYYDPGLAGKPMAWKGKPYNPNAYTAARNGVRFGTKLKVTNRRTGKSVIVTVTDRCNCSIDLSTAAFQAIANKKQGRVPVTITKP